MDAHTSVHTVRDVNILGDPRTSLHLCCLGLGCRPGSWLGVECRRAVPPRLPRQSSPGEARGRRSHHRGSGRNPYGESRWPPPVWAGETWQTCGQRPGQTHPESWREALSGLGSGQNNHPSSYHHHAANHNDHHCADHHNPTAHNHHHPPDHHDSPDHHHHPPHSHHQASHNYNPSYSKDNYHYHHSRTYHPLSYLSSWDPGTPG